MCFKIIALLRASRWMGLLMLAPALGGLNAAHAQEKPNQAQSEPSTRLDQHLDLLYSMVRARFDANPHFKNNANPRFFKTGYDRNPLPPEYQMPSADFFKLSMKAYCLLLESPKASEIKNASHYGIMDYGQDATFRRFYVYDVAHQEIIHNTWGTHASNTSMDRYFGLSEVGIEGTHDYGFQSSDTNISHFFSNREGSELSTLGMAIAQDSPYQSDTFNSKALRLDGVDGPLNNNLLDRAIVLHAWGMFSEQVRLSQRLTTSEGCLMFGNDDFYQGTDHVNVSEVIINSMLGSPILLYHERLNNPTLNEKAYRDELNNYAAMQIEFAEHMKDLASQYGWTDSQTVQYSAVFSKMMKEQVYDLMVQTHQYFQTASRFIGKDPKSESNCMKALGI